jgi:hypothetical protein
LIVPVSLRRNFQTLPLTMGGSAQTNTMMLSTTFVVRLLTERIDAARNPMIRLDASRTRVMPNVRSSACQKVAAPRMPAKLLSPTHAQFPMMFDGPTLLNAIRKRTNSG